MFDVVTYALLKKKIEQAATGITGAEYKEGKLIFTLGDGSKIEIPLDISSGVAGALVDESGALVISFSDGTNLIYNVPALIANALAPLEEKQAALENQLTNINTALDKHIEDFNDLGLSIVDGLLCMTYNNSEGE
jgi:hypothetical protein